MKKAVMFLHVLTLICLVAVMTANAQEKRYDIPVGDSPSRGPENAPVTIIEFLDYQ